MLHKKECEHISIWQYHCSKFNYAAAWKNQTKVAENEISVNPRAHTHTYSTRSHHSLFKSRRKDGGRVCGGEGQMSGRDERRNRKLCRKRRHQCPLQVVSALIGCRTWVKCAFKADSGILPGCAYNDTRGSVRCQWNMNKDSWLFLAKGAQFGRWFCLVLKFPHWLHQVLMMQKKVALWQLGLFRSLSLSLPLSVQWSQREPDSGSSKKSLQRSCGDQEPVSSTFSYTFPLCVCVCVCHSPFNVYLQMCTTPMCLCVNISLC